MTGFLLLLHLHLLLLHLLLLLLLLQFWVFLVLLFLRDCLDISIQTDIRQLFLFVVVVAAVVVIFGFLSSSIPSSMSSSMSSSIPSPPTQLRLSIDSNDRSRNQSLAICPYPSNPTDSVVDSGPIRPDSSTVSSGAIETADRNQQLIGDDGSAQNKSSNTIPAQSPHRKYSKQQSTGNQILRLHFHLLHLLHLLPLLHLLHGWKSTAQLLVFIFADC